MTISYPDVSNHNGDMPLQAGTVACFAKSSEGTGYRDPYYLHYKSEAQRVGALFGAYHFLRQGDGAGQARFAYSIVGPGVPMMIDFEPEYDQNGNPISLPSLADAIAFRDTYRALGGLVRVNYLPRWYWAGHLGSPSLSYLADLALVSSDYEAYSDAGPGWAPYGGLTPAIWQWTDKQPYSGQQVDFNAFRGTVDQFRVLLGLGSGLQPSPLEAPMQDALYAINPGPKGEQAGIWLYADGRYWHVPDLPTRDEIVAKLGIAEKPLDYALHQVLLALTATGAPVDAKALAASIVTALGPIVQQAVAAGVQPDYDHMAVVLEAHLAATFATGK